MEAIKAPAVPALDFERTNWVGDISVTSDAFYTPPRHAPTNTPGKLLRLDEDIDPKKYLLPPAVTVTRHIYLSQTLAGALVPVSAAILWPYAPRVQPDGKYPIVAWAHGTSGLGPDAAPSHHKNLWQHYLAPYPLALAGYVVVATDYAGLGVHHDHDGNEIVHEYLAAPAHANDIVYAVQAAREAYTKLSSEFVVVGHSQGGGAAWAVAERQAAKEPIEGLQLLGCVPISPTTRIVDEPGPFGSIIWTAMCRGMKQAFPEADLGDLLTEDGLKRYEAIHETKATGVASVVIMLSGSGELLRPGWRQNEHVHQYQAMVQTGGKKLGCPLLIVHGEADPNISIKTVQAAVDKTRSKSLESQVDLIVLPNITHAPAMTAGMSLWLRWIADRFAGNPLDGPTSGTTSVIESARPAARYEGEQNWYLERATEYYQAP